MYPVLVTQAYSVYPVLVTQGSYHTLMYYAGGDARMILTKSGLDKHILAKIWCVGTSGMGVSHHLT